jgi:DNA repair protein RadC
MTIEGPRERYTLDGPEGFGDADLLALVLGTGSGGRSVRGIAADLLDTYGGVAQIASSPVRALTRVPGVGPARAVRVHAACALARRRERSHPRARVHDAESAWRLLRPALDELDHEQLHALYLDRRGGVLDRRRLTQGNDGYTIVDPRQVLRPAVQLGACALIVAHNHPSGDPTPSDGDRSCTWRLAAAAEVLGMRLLDHLVLGGGTYVSMAEQGELEGLPSAPPMLAEPQSTRPRPEGRGPDPR